MTKMTNPYREIRNIALTNVNKTVRKSFKRFRKDWCTD